MGTLFGAPPAPPPAPTPAPIAPPDTQQIKQDIISNDQKRRTRPKGQAANLLSPADAGTNAPTATATLLGQ